MQSGFNALQADNLRALLPKGLDLCVQPSGPPMEKDMFCISPPPSLHAQHESVHSLIRGMSSSVTFLMNTIELHKRDERKDASHDFLLTLQEANRQIHRGLESLKLLLFTQGNMSNCAGDPTTVKPLVLWVDERYSNGSLGESVLRELGQNVLLHVARDILGAKKRLQSCHYDLLLSGYYLRGGTALDLIRHMKECGNWVHCVVITRKGTERIAAECLEAGCMGYLNGDMLREGGRLFNTVYRVLMANVQCKTFDAYLRRTQRLAMTDTLTSLHSRFFVEYLLDMELQRSKRYANPFCVALIDVDGFKEINDRFGHKCGDTVLRKLAGVLKNLIRSTDHIGRFGGDEFLLIMPQTTLANGIHLCNRIVEGVSCKTVQGDQDNHGLTLSIGLTHWRGEDRVHPSQILEATDDALYQAKEQGRNRVCHNADLNPETSR